MPVADAGIGLSYIVTGLMDGNNWVAVLWVVVGGIFTVVAFSEAWRN
jgi:hypothetical protein